MSIVVHIAIHVVRTANVLGPLDLAQTSKRDRHIRQRDVLGNGQLDGARDGVANHVETLVVGILDVDFVHDCVGLGR